MLLPGATAVSLAVSVAVSLAGCAHSSVAAPFASDSRVLDAALDAYSAYLEVSDQIFRDGGADPTRISEVTAGAQTESDLNSFAELRRGGGTGRGSTSFDSVQLVHHNPGARQRVVSVLLCADLSKVDMLDARGSSTFDHSQPSRAKFQVDFDRRSAHDPLLVVSGHMPAPDEAC